MNPNTPSKAPNPYLKTKILTASPEELRLMLYEGVIRFCHQAKKAMQDKDIEAKHNSLMRAQKIVPGTVDKPEAGRSSGVVREAQRVVRVHLPFIGGCEYGRQRGGDRRGTGTDGIRKTDLADAHGEAGERRWRFELFSRSGRRRRGPTDRDQ